MSVGGTVTFFLLYAVALGGAASVMFVLRAVKLI